MNKKRKRTPSYPVGTKITYYREQKGITLNKLANTAGVSQSYLRAIELETQNPTVGTLILLCQALEISLEQFFQDDINDSFLKDPVVHRIYQLTPPQKTALKLFLNTLETGEEKEQ